MKKPTDPLLLDINVLLALAWPNHQFHALACRRMQSAAHWTTCALTQLAFVRLLITSAVVGVAKPAGEALAVLAAMVNGPQHVYWSRLPALRAPEWPGNLPGCSGRGNLDAPRAERARAAAKRISVAARPTGGRPEKGGRAATGR
ncbi:MAG: hypothetical protein ACRD01_09960 [Terriglobales bacterium]